MRELREIEIPLRINWSRRTPRRDAPVRGGIPLPAGAVRDTGRLRLLDPQGRDVPLQSDALAYWPDRSVQWALVDFLARARTAGAYRLLSPQRRARPTPTALRVRESKRRITVVTGPLKFTVLKQGGGWLHEAWLDSTGQGCFDPDHRIVRPGSDAFIQLRYRPPEQRSKIERQPPPGMSEDEASAMAGTFRATADPDAVAVIEEQGPNRVVVRCSGLHVRDDGRAYAPYVIRIHALAGQAYLHVTHTFTSTVDLRMVDTLALGVSLRYRMAGPARFAVGTDSGPVTGRLDRRTVWQVYRNAEPKAWPSFDQFRGESAVWVDGRLLAAGGVPPGWIDVRGGGRGVGLGVRDLKQMYPKELQVAGNAGELRFLINPEHGPEYDWYNGVRPEDISPTGGHWTHAGGAGISRSHDFLVSFFTGRGQTPALTASLNDGPLVQCRPSWYAESGALGPMIARDARRFPAAERWHRCQAEWLYRHANEWFKWWGDIDYGGIQCYYLREEGHWCNVLERFGWILAGYQTQGAPWMYYMRTGDRRFFSLARAAARHVADVELDATGGRRMFSLHWGQTGDWWHNDPIGPFWGWLLTGDHRLREQLMLSAPRCGGGFSPQVTPDRELLLRIVNGARIYAITGDSDYIDRTHHDAMCMVERQLPSGRLEGDKGFTMPNFGVDALALAYELTGDKRIQEALLRYADWACTAGGRDQNQWVGRSERRLTLALYGWAYHYTRNPKYLWPIAADLNGRHLLAERLRFRPKWRNPGCNIDYRRSDHSRPVHRAMFSQTYVEAKVMLRLPYALAALKAAGLDEAACARVVDTDSVGYAVPERGTHKIRKKRGSDFETVPLGAAAGVDPRQPDPYGWGDVEYEIQYTAMETVFGSLPFGAVVDYLGIPFHLRAGTSMLVLGADERRSIRLPPDATALHFLGHVCGNGDSELGAVGALYVFHFADGSSETVPLANCVDYEDVRMWHLSRNAPLARSWWPVYTYSKIRHINVWTYRPTKPVCRVDVVDTGLGHKFTLLALTAETPSPPAEGQTRPLTSRPVRGQTLRDLTWSVPSGRYDLALTLSGDRPLHLCVRQGARTLVQRYGVAGAFYGRDNRERLVLPIVVRTGRLNLALAADDDMAAPDQLKWEFLPRANEAAGAPTWQPRDGSPTWTLHSARLLPSRGKKGTSRR